MLKAEFKEVSGYSPNLVFIFIFDTEIIPLNLKVFKVFYNFVLHMCDMCVLHMCDSLSQLCVYECGLFHI